MNEPIYVYDILAVEYNLEPLTCLYCDSHEVTFHQYANDAYCEECGRWQIEEATIAYKVLRRGFWNETLISAWAKKKYCLKYKPGQKTVAPGNTQLFVFKELDDARMFQLYDRDREVWTACCDTIAPMPWMCASNILEAIDEWWASPEQWSSLFSSDNSPKGTYGTKWVLPLERVT